ncbi:MAG: periplasmic heavy metal sensor [Saprospiraceae bacterium]|nr:periplasmic heavy metal sensor [Saprospiraceae bacterium]
MKKETLLTITVLALLLLNFGTLGYLFFQRPPHERPGRPGKLDREIVETLQLNAAQQQQFEQLKTAHHEQMLSSDQAYRLALDNYFALLKNDSFVPAQRDSLQGVLSRIQQERVTVTFQHFSELKALCSAEQRQHFAELLPALMQVMLPNRDRQGPPRNKR